MQDLPQIKSGNLSWGRAMQNLLVPPVCIACVNPLDDRRCLQICEHCCDRVSRPELKRKCRRCSARFRGEASTIPQCYFCQDVRLPFASVTSVANYDGLLRDLVIRMKSRHGQAVALQLGVWLARIVESRRQSGEIDSIDIVSPMPIHWMRKLRRGFNVAGLLVESIAQSAEFNGKQQELLVASRKTRKQGTLSITQRFDNVKDCFEISGKPDLKGASILLVDDVMTSGATAIQAGNRLLRAGARQIHLAIVARGIGRQP